MTQGNLINRIMERTLQPSPIEGMGATVCAYTDRYACTVVAVDGVGKGQIVTIQEDAWKRTDGNGMSDSQTYEYSRDKHGRYFYFRKNKDGRWFEVRKNRQTNRWNLCEGGCGLVLNRRDKRYDFSF